MEFDLVAHTVPLVSFGDLGFRFILLCFSVWILRLAWVIVKKRVRGDTVYVDLLTMFGVSSFVALASIARLAHMAGEVGELVNVFGSSMLVYDLDAIRSVQLGVGVSLFGYSLTFICYHCNAWLKSRITRIIIRWRFALIGISVLVFVGLHYYNTKIVPNRNLARMYQLLGSVEFVETFKDPLHIMLYEVIPSKNLFPPPPPPLDFVQSEEELVKEEKMDRRFNNHRLAGSGVAVEQRELIHAMHHLDVYKKTNNYDRGAYDYLVRFVGDDSVVDFWVDWRNSVGVYAGVFAEPNGTAILEFKETYAEVMERKSFEGGTLGYLYKTGDLTDRLKEMYTSYSDGN